MGGHCQFLCFYLHSVWWHAWRKLYQLCSQLDIGIFVNTQAGILIWCVYMCIYMCVYVCVCMWVLSMFIWDLMAYSINIIFEVFEGFEQILEWIKRWWVYTSFQYSKIHRQGKNETPVLCWELAVFHLWQSNLWVPNWSLMYYTHDCQRKRVKECALLTQGVWLNEFSI